MLERLQFSIPITITIAAPVDIVWDAITDIPSYPRFLSSVVSVESQPNNTTTSITSSKGSSTTLKGSNKSNSTTDNNNLKEDTTTSSHRFLGSRWKITRISVLENQKYAAPLTITQHSITDTSRILTFSTHEMLGATCSLKLVVENNATASGSTASLQQSSVDNNSTANIINNNNNRSGGNNNNSNRGSNSSNSSERRDSGASATSSTTKQQQQQRTFEGKEAVCQLTVIMTMIPYQFFVKLLGVMCCLCLLKWRARIAMECDLEDVTAFCEGKYEEQLKAEKSLEEGGGRGGGGEEGNDDLGKSSEDGGAK